MRAVCLSCGATKWGALTACPKCETKPESYEDQAKSLLAGEDHLDAAAMEALAEKVRAGEPIAFDPNEVSALAADLEKFPVPPLGFTLLVVGLPLIGLVLLTVFALVVLGG